MPAVANPRVVLAKLPGDSLPVAGEHLVLDKSHEINLDTVPLNGGFLSKTLLLSPEPYQRERMRDPSIPSYSTAYILGAPIVSFGLVVVLRSEKDGVAVGDYMFGMTTWEAYAVQPYVDGRVKYKPEDWPPYTFDMDSLALQKVQDPQGAFPWTRYCSILGIPGLTAFVGFEGLVDGKEGETIYVSSGASAVGSLIIQFAKIRGMKVIASASTDAKVDYMRSLGADVPFNYRTQSVPEVLAKNGPLDVYWDNVGGETLEHAIDYAAFHARIVICGTISEYNIPREQRHGIKNTTLIFKKRLNVRGFLVPDLVPQYAGRFYAEVPALLMQGKIKSEEFVTEGIENAAQALIDNLKGGEAGVGKAVIKIADV